MADGYDPNCINCWSGPRCCSTSLMYSFAQRSDTEVLDEPLYANYLLQTGLDRPYKDQLLKAQVHDGNALVQEVLLGPRKSKVLYAKHIAKQKVGLKPILFQRANHMILVREPYSVVQSFSKVLAPSFQELGYGALLEIFSDLRNLGRQPIVIVSDELIQNPEPMLRSICTALNLPFEDKMLTWTPGPKSCDGLWAPWWYHTSHMCDGFTKAVGLAVPGAGPVKEMPEALRPLLGECWVMYELLRRYAIKPVDMSVPRQIADVNSGEDESSSKKKSGTHVYVDDPRNANILIGMRDGVNGTFHLVWRPTAKVSVLDSAFMLGDGVWEGLRLHKGVVVFAEEHLDRLYEGAKALDMDLGLTQRQLLELVYRTVDANGMGRSSGIHIRLMVSRGLKPTPYQNPITTIGQPTIVIIPEYKEAASAPKEKGIKLFTCHVRRGAADVQDPMWNSHSKLNCIAACIQANKSGADEALMLDPHGFVATCNSVNFFCVRKGEVWAPTPKYQLHGITRENILHVCRANSIPVRETDFSLTQVYSADEAFVTGTFAGLIPVTEVDGRIIGTGDGTRAMVRQLQQLYIAHVDRYAEQGRQTSTILKPEPPTSPTDEEVE